MPFVFKAAKLNPARLTATPTPPAQSCCQAIHHPELLACRALPQHPPARALILPPATAPHGEDSPWRWTCLGAEALICPRPDKDRSLIAAFLS